MLPSEMTAERLLWRQQVRALPGAIWRAWCRLIRVEPRWYLTDGDRVLARFTSEQDYELFMHWLRDSHGDTFRLGHEWGEAAGRLANDS